MALSEQTPPLFPFVFRARRGRFPQADQAHGQAGVFQTAEHFHRHVFGGGAETEPQGFHVPAFEQGGDLAFARVVAVVDKGVVERLDNGAFDDGFEVGEVHDHSVFRATLNEAV